MVELQGRVSSCLMAGCGSWYEEAAGSSECCLLFIYFLLFSAPEQCPDCWREPPEPRRADPSVSCLSAGQRGHGSLSAEVPCQLQCHGHSGLPHPCSSEVLPEGVSKTVWVSAGMWQEQPQAVTSLTVGSFGQQASRHTQAPLQALLGLLHAGGSQICLSGVCTDIIYYCTLILTVPSSTLHKAGAPALSRVLPIPPNIHAVYLQVSDTQDKQQWACWVC